MTLKNTKKKPLFGAVFFCFELPFTFAAQSSKRCAITDGCAAHAEYTVQISHQKSLNQKSFCMGRIFEVRKATMFARWDRMAKQFTRIGKEIAIAVKAGGSDPSTNAALRRCFQNARSVGMPKDRVEAAIKRANGKEMVNYDEILYEGYAPHGVAILVETATDNHVRTVANVKSHFTKGAAHLATVVAYPSSSKKWEYSNWTLLVSILKNWNWN